MHKFSQVVGGLRAAPGISDQAVPGTCTTCSFLIRAASTFPP